ncbi:alpha/beta hydrolase-fold protein [Cytophagaceae bacterium DM2B3-1]|uniref:Alpha/beta hydrolase-fold protein n=1 Tax=Xanthocytophaga flava TaxID=3048013 RepID=A0ABT7CCW5_9BACT|nr:alpha/beta hydrolase-fold protein [Xanthocytophaga flavus]MDJ1491537.1 alpha/beta hydrolase-fold protein [Xanthocytophaga flavus]
MKKMYLPARTVLWCTVCVFFLVACNSSKSKGPQFLITFSDSLSKDPLDGRLLLMIAQDTAKGEPRNQVGDSPGSAQIFGIDVDGWKAGEEKTIDGTVFGYPLKSLSELTAGDYYVQALLHKYETCKLKDGRVLKLPMDRGEGQNWRTAPGNLYSVPAKVTIGTDGNIAVTLTKANPAIAVPKDTKYIKHIRIQSKLLTEFWGRPMYLGAHVLLPEGFDEHPEAHYPLCINHGHFPSDFDGFSPEPPAADMDTSDYSDRFHIYGYKKIVAQEAHNFYKTWTSKNFPRMLIIEIQHANPYYDDSYAVNSANIGPYGDAITYELIPYIEKQFRGIGQGWARFLYGGSTGGWEALAAQIFYPDQYGGCFAACPDPIDFRAYTQVNIYKDKNAYYTEGPFRKVSKPGYRNYLGHITTTIADMNHLELVLGTKTRSGGQWDIWEAVYSPVGEDGYPKRIFDKMTGEIDTMVAQYWRNNYDLTYIMQRDWSALGPKLTGKINIYCGDMDNYYLNNAVYLAEDFLKKTKNFTEGGEVKYGDRAEHCWNGDPTLPNYLSRLHYNTMYVPKILKLIEKNAPKGADLKSWRY